jgi:hypothetical protein
MTSRQRKRATWTVAEVDTRLRNGRPLNVDDYVEGSCWVTTVGVYVDMRWGALAQHRRGNA